MKTDATGNIPDSYRLPKDDPPPAEYPEGDIIECEMIGVTYDNKRIRVKWVDWYGTWENGYKGTISISPDDPELKDKLNSEV